MIPNSRLLSPDAAVIDAPAPATEAAPKFGLDVIRNEIAVVKSMPEPVRHRQAPRAPEATPTPEVTPEVSKETAIPEVKESSKTDKSSASDDPEAFMNSLSGKSKTRFIELANKYGEKVAEDKMKSAKLLTPEVESKLSAYEKRTSELESELRQLGVERSPEFTAKFVERPKAIKANLENIAKAYEIPFSNLMTAVESGDRKQLNEMLGEVGIIDRNDAAQSILEYQKIQADRASVAKDTEAAMKVLQEKRDGEVKAYVEKLTGERRNVLEKEVLPIIEKECEDLALFDGDEGQSLKSDLMSSISKMNATDLEKMSAKDRAAMIASAFASKPLFQAVQAKNARIAELEEQLAKYDKGKPAVGGGSPPKAPVEKEMTFIQKAKAGLL